MSTTVSDFSEVQALINSYFNAMDRRDFPAALDCLTEDVDWRVSANRSGRDEVAATLRDFPGNFVSRHLVSNLEIAGGTEIEAFFVVQTFVHFLNDGDATPYPISPPSALTDVEATVVRTDDGPRIKRIAVSTIMRNPPQ